MLNGQTGAFGGRMIQIDIEPFTREETKRYIDERSNNIKFNDEGFNQFYECTRGIPIYINSLCSILPGNQICDENIILENILSNKGIIEYDFNKKYIISDKMLKTWLKTKYEQNGRYPL